MTVGRRFMEIKMYQQGVCLGQSYLFLLSFQTSAYQ
jgi:hypothetical protein